MFNQFLYLLRARGLKVSTKEWLTLMEALEMGLHGSRLTGFYQLCLAVLCKSETEYDSFLSAFVEFFHDQFLYDEEGELKDEISEQLMDWLNNPGRKGPRLIRFDEEDITEEMKNWDRAEIEKKFRKKLSIQRKEHNGGKLMVGTHGISPHGNDGFNSNGIRVGGKAKDGKALRVAGPRDYRDFREDNVLSIRQFQMAFRRLRHFAAQNGAEEEFDIEGTINDTCNKGGLLQVRYRKPRRNDIKVLLLMDSGGSMNPYSQLCSKLFQAANNAHRFKDLKIYYFHNCIDAKLYTHPSLKEQYEVNTYDILRQCGRDYRVILVGDATMDLSDLTYVPPSATYHNRGYSGRDWLNHILSRYKYTVWLNPRPRSAVFGEWGETYDIISSIFPMYQLTVAGLEQAMRRLLTAS